MGLRLGLGLGLNRQQYARRAAIGLDFRSMQTGSAPAGWTFTRSTSGTYFDASGVLQTAATNVLRISRDPVSGELGYLAEPGRTNLALYSTLPGGGSPPTGWTAASGSGTATASIYGNADGAVAYSFTSSASRNYFTQTSSTLSASTAYSWSVRLESVSGTVALNDILHITSLPAGASTAWYVDGVATSASAAATSGTLLHVLVTVSTTPGTGVMRIGCGCSANSTGTVVLSRPQLEAGSYPTSYIPTTTVAVARGADLLTTALSAAHAAALSVAGTMVARFSFLGGDSTQVNDARTVVQIDGAANNYHRINNRSFSVGARTFTASVEAYAQATGGTLATNTPARVAYAFQTDDCRFARDGSLATADSAPSAMPAVTDLTIGATAAGTNQLGGLIHDFRLYTSRMTDAQLQAQSS